MSTDLVNLPPQKRPAFPGAEGVPRGSGGRELPVSQRESGESARGESRASQHAAALLSPTHLLARGTVSTSIHLERGDLISVQREARGKLDSPDSQGWGAPTEAGEQAEAVTQG